MKALITGISGFVGKYLAAYLLEQGYEVYGVDRTGAELKGCEIEICDILNKNKLSAIIEKIRPDAVFHLAAFSSVKKSFSSSELTKKINVEGTRNLLDAVVSAKINPTVLIVSSLQVYGNPKELPITESSALKPENPYGESKVEQEKLCKEYELKIIIVRSFNHTGPGQTADFVLPSFAKQIVEIERGKLTEIKVGNLDIERDFTDVRDIVRAYLLAVQKCKVGETYNVCSGQAYNLAKALDMLKSKSTTDIKIVVESKRIRKNDVPVLYGDNAKFSKATGWKPEILFEQTLKDLLEHWRTLE